MYGGKPQFDKRHLLKSLTSDNTFRYTFYVVLKFQRLIFNGWYLFNSFIALIYSRRALGAHVGRELNFEVFYNQG